MGHLDGDTALITGAASGIGRAIAERFAREGAGLVLVDVAADRLREVAGELRREADATVSFVIGDVAAEDTFRTATSQAEEKFGDLDVLVNNACAARHRSLTDLSPEQWRQTIEDCLTSVFFGLKHAIPVMKRAGSGSVINISSVNSHVASPGMPAYTAAKGGVVGLTRQVAIEYGPDGIRSNAIRPGFIETAELRKSVLTDPEEQQAAVESCPLRRIGRPEDIAGAALFLATNESAFVNGHVLTVDGGTSVQWAPTLVRPGLREKAGLEPL